MLNPTKRYERIVRAIRERRRADAQVFYKKFAWYPVKLSSDNWILGKYYWVSYRSRYDGWTPNNNPKFKRGDPIEKLDSEELVIRELQGSD